MDTTNLTLPPPTHKHRLRKWLVVILIVLLLAITGALAFLLMQANDNKISLENDKKQLQSKVDDLTKQLTEKSGPSETANTATCSPATPLAQSVKDNIKAAITSQNTAAIESLLTDPVKVVLAASEKGGPVTPAQAITDLDYLKSGTEPWDFNLPATTLAGYKAGSYGSYFGDRTYVGKSANGYIVSFDFNDCAKIHTIFMATNNGLLL